jgi:chemotaxis protein MotB
MIKKLTLGILILALSTSCVSKKVFTDLEKKYVDLRQEQKALTEKNAELLAAKTELENQATKLNADLDKLNKEKQQLDADYASLSEKYKNLKDSHDALEKNSAEALQANLSKNRDLLSQLDKKTKTLNDLELANKIALEDKTRAIEANQLKNNQLKAELDEKAKALAIEQAKLSSSQKRLAELEAMIASKEAAMKKLKETLSKALNSFEGKGLTVEQKNGKVYVSMENKLLFNSGSWNVGPEGRKAVVEVGKVLGDNPDIAVLIEGHTDNDAFNSTGPIADNWDLSTKRATAIVAILTENKTINKQNLTAAGRGEYAPLANNDTEAGKAKNRRIEMILTPRLDEISKMLNEIN